METTDSSHDNNAKQTLDGPILYLRWKTSCKGKVSNLDKASIRDEAVLAAPRFAVTFRFDLLCRVTSDDMDKIYQKCAFAWTPSDFHHGSERQWPTQKAR